MRVTKPFTSLISCLSLRLFAKFSSQSFAALIMGLLGVFPSQASDKIILKTAVYEGCPFICLDGSGVFPTILKLAVENSPYEIEFIPLPFERSKTLLREGKIDLLPGMVKNGIPNTLYPEEWLFSTQMCFFTKASDGWTYRDIKSLDERTIAVERGIIHTEEFYAYLKKNDDNFIQLAGNVLERQIGLLQKQRIDAFTAERTVLKQYIKDKALDASIVRNAGCFEPEYEFIAVSAQRKDSEKIVNFLNKRLKEVKKTKTFHDYLK